MWVFMCMCVFLFSLFAAEKKSNQIKTHLPAPASLYDEAAEFIGI